MHLRLWPTRKALYLHDVAVLHAPPPAAPGPAFGGIEAREYGASSSADILRLHQRLEHRMFQRRLDQRFANGLRFFAFWRDAELLGSSWAAMGGGRYVDELNWYLPIAPTAFWLRDVFTPPTLRGQGLFAAFVQQLAQQHVPGCTGVWSDVDWVNVVSMKAHAKIGFTLHARVWALDFNGRARLRSPMLPWALPVQEIAPQQRWIWLTSEHRRRHEALLA